MWYVINTVFLVALAASIWFKRTQLHFVLWILRVLLIHSHLKLQGMQDWRRPQRAKKMNSETVGMSLTSLSVPDYRHTLFPVWPHRAQIPQHPRTQGCFAFKKCRRMAPHWWCAGRGKDERHCVLLLCSLPGKPVEHRAPLYLCDWRYHHKYIVMATGGMEDLQGAPARPAGGPLLPRLGRWALLLSLLPSVHMRLDSLGEGDILREVFLFCFVFLTHWVYLPVLYPQILELHKMIQT